MFPNRENSNRVTSQAHASKKIFISQVFHTLITRGAVLLLTFFYTVLLARLLGPQGQGLYSTFIVVPVFLVILCEMGVRQSISCHIGGKDYSESSLFSAMLLVFAWSSLTGMILCLLAFFVMGMDQYGYRLIFLFSLIVPLTLFSRYGFGIFLGKVLVERVNRLQAVLALMQVVMLFLCVYWLKMGITGAACAQIASLAIISLAVLVLLSGNFSGFNLEPAIAIVLVKKGIVFAVALLILQLNYKMDVLMLAFFKDQREVGLYAAGVNVCDLIWQIPLAIGMVLFSQGTNRRDDLNFLKASLGKIRIVFWLSLGIVALFYFLAKLIVQLLYGSPYMESYLVIQLLLPGTWIMVYVLQVQLINAGRGYPHLAIYAFLPGLLLNFLLNLWLIPSLGKDGAAIASTISYTVSSATYFVFMKNYLKTALEPVTK